MATTTHETGTVRSGDVTLFYRRFGTPGGLPVLIAHGANYYDSHDWIEVASALAGGREIVAYDMRGFGESSWSASKDYSHDAQLADVAALIDHLGWSKTVFMGHSRGGGVALLAAARLEGRAAALVLVDYSPAGGGHAPAPAGAKATIFPSAASALDAMSRDKAATTPARLDMILKPVPGGFVFRSRDPDFANAVPTTPGWSAKIAAPEMWAELARVGPPTLIVRALRGANYTHEILARVRSEFPRVVVNELEAGHDVAGGAPRALIASVHHFLATRVER
ncbi:MAG TPA: alpha/beta hydrolase [Stellaceae bacterium]|nr:alpha/beta hydrolase [Stellaceae bacterium]